MSSKSSNGKRIAKNAILLYLRTFITMCITLLTSRIILRSLGVNDYGLYNVVGGVVAMFSVLTGSLSAAISRFTTFELGKNDNERLKRVFCTSINIQIILIVVIVLLAETIGLWFLNYKMNIEEGRIVAANWVFQFSIITFVINLLSVPYNASIIAHERMSAFAYISILDAILKLAIAFLISFSPIDKLVFYALLLMLCGLVIRLIYARYCNRHFEECRYKIIFDKSLLKEMFGFAGWNFIGASSDVFRDQGGNIIIDLFFGTSVNAARAVAMQVSSAITTFVNNFLTAVRPQITKSYASGDYSYMMQLIYRGSKFSGFILLFFALPVYITTPYILQLWLGIVPEHTVNFVRIILIYVMNETLSGPMVTAMLATGRIRNYQLIVGGSQLLNLPISYLCLLWGCPAEAVFLVAIIISCLGMFLRVYMLRSMINLSFRKFYIQVYFRVLLVIIAAAFAPVVVLYHINLNFYTLIILCVLSIISSVISIYYVGCTSEERVMVKSATNKVISKIRR
jgi:O-antigen/teichoic acid export membrane protein